MKKQPDSRRVLQTLESAVTRFNERVEKTLHCWNWKGRLSPKGYGILEVNSTSIQAHRLSWVLAGRKIDITREMDHLCRNRACVNPAHLEQVTAQVNQQRGNSPSGINSRKTHCPQGHPYNEENTLRAGKRQGRKCRTCELARKRAYWARDKALHALKATE